MAEAPASGVEQPADSQHELLPDWLNAHRVEIDEAIKRVLSEYRPEIRSMAEDAACRGRKLRGTLSLQMLEWCGWVLKLQERSLLKLLKR